jgi:hypothetical protein
MAGCGPIWSATPRSPNCTPSPRRSGCRDEDSIEITTISRPNGTRSRCGWGRRRSPAGTSSRPCTGVVCVAANLPASRRPPPADRYVLRSACPLCDRYVLRSACPLCDRYVLRSACLLCDRYVLRSACLLCDRYVRRSACLLLYRWRRGPAPGTRSGEIADGVSVVLTGQGWADLVRWATGTGGGERVPTAVPTAGQYVGTVRRVVSSRVRLVRAVSSHRSCRAGVWNRRGRHSRLCSTAARPVANCGSLTWAYSRRTAAV